jgi:hypothetical protein
MLVYCEDDDSTDDGAEGREGRNPYSSPIYVNGQDSNETNADGSAGNDGLFEDDIGDMEYGDLFRLIDRNSDGQLSLIEFIKALRAHPIVAKVR